MTDRARTVAPRQDDTPTPPGGQATPQARPGRRRRWIVVGAALLVLLLGIGVGVYLVNRPETPTAAPSAPDPTAISNAPTIRISPKGTGDGTGSDWSRAAPLSALPDLVGSAAPGTQILLQADAGPYDGKKALEIAHGGSSDAPVYIRGVATDDKPMKATIAGDRVDPYRPNGNPGNELFRLLSGADNLVFQDLDFRNIGNGAVRVGDDIQNLTIRNITATNVRRLLEDFRSGDGSGTATISGLRISDVKATGFSRAFARIRYDSNNIVIERVTGDSAGQDGDDFAQGLDIGDTVHGLLIRDTSMTNAIDTSGKYWNGDGFSIEEGTYDVRLERTFAAGNTDAGYDIKTRGATLIDTVSQDNKRNYRFWGQADVRNCIARDANNRGGSGGQAQIFTTASAVATLTNCTITDNDPRTIVFDIDMTSRLTVENSKVVHSPQGRWSTIDPGGVLATPGTTGQ